MILSTDQVRPNERMSYWRDVICRTFVQLDVDTAASAFAGQVSSVAVGPVRFSRIDANPMGVRRRARHIAEAQEDELLMALHLTGEALGIQDDRQAVLAPGDMALFDAGRPYTVEFAGDRMFHHLVIQMPRAMLRSQVSAIETVTAIPVRHSEPIGGLVSSFLTGLARTANDLEPRLHVALAQQAVDLIATALGSRPGPSQASGEAMSTLYRRRVYAFIEAHLADRALSPSMIASAHHISPRYLHKLFTSEPASVARLIWDRRLERCRLDLENPLFAGRSVGQIGRRWGFQNAAHFSRAFRERFGHPPSAHRGG
ncbi:helix-turn-helix domain-containing protein [Micromonospora sp. NPDC005806]|uniref:AraC-like ligand-binding domain-containing protein n=1 Tax=Micromonospora sp. NPDC005806 TaxID=3364234 RepID=UPI003690A861